MTRTYQINKRQGSKLFKKLIENGLKEIPIKSEYEEWRLKADSIAIYYKSGKLVIQGRDISEINNVLDSFLNQDLTEGLSSLSNDIGADEVGKGDYFGPLVVSAVYLPLSQIEKIRVLGVTDSKKISDRDIVRLAGEIKLHTLSKTAVISPPRYNRRYSQIKNISIMLSELHAENILSLVSEVRDNSQPISRVIIDQFSSVKSRLGDVLEKQLGETKLLQFHKAETELSVAAASILARAELIAQFEHMSKKYGRIFPKGAAHVIDFAKEFVQEYGADELEMVAKTSFKTTKAILS